MHSPRRPTTGESLKEYGRGLAGGLLFSLPLLYTMEVWWAGFIASPFRLVALLIFTFVLLLAYNRFAGFRYDAGWAEVAIDSVEELGLGLVTSAGILYLLGRIGTGVSLEEGFSKIVVEATVVAIGFSVGTAQLGITENGQKSPDRFGKEARGFAGQLVIAFCGAVLFAANVGPTEEIVVVGVETDPFRLVGLALLTIVLGAGILYFIDFTRTHHIIDVGGHFDIIMGSIVTYAIALVASAAMLWFFGRFESTALEVSVAQTVVLAFPATVGASAGRALIQ